MPSELPNVLTNLSEEDINKAVKEAEQYEAEDKKRKEQVEARNQLDGLIFTVEKTLKDNADKISEEDKAKVEAAVSKAKEELNSDDNDRIVKATEKLSNESQAIFGKIYQQANPNGDPNAQGGATGGDEFHQ